MIVRKNNSIFSETLLVLVFLLLLLNLFVVACGIRVAIMDGAPKLMMEGEPISSKPSEKTGDIASRMKDCALKLKSYGFLDESAQVFDKYVSLKPGENTAAVYFELGQSYLDAGDYRKALFNFYLAEFSLPSEELKTNIGAREVLCLEKLGRSIDAVNELDRKIGVEKPKEVPEDSNTLATVGQKRITLKDLNEAIQTLPVPVQDKIRNDIPEKKNFLKQMVLLHLLYDKAIRIRMDRDPEITQKLEAIRFQFIANTMLETELGTIPEPTPADLDNFYKAHLDQFKSKNEKGEETVKSLEEVKQTVREGFLAQKKSEKVNGLLNDLARAENVQLFEARLDGEK